MARHPQVREDARISPLDVGVEFVSYESTGATGQFVVEAPRPLVVYGGQPVDTGPSLFPCPVNHRFDEFLTDSVSSELLLHVEILEIAGWSIAPGVGMREEVDQPDHLAIPLGESA